MSQSQVECPVRTPRVIYVYEAVVHRPIIILLPGDDVSPVAHLCHALLPSVPLDRSVERSHDLRRRASALVTQGFRCCCDGPAGADRCETLWSSAVQICSMWGDTIQRVGPSGGPMGHVQGAAPCCLLQCLEQPHTAQLLRLLRVQKNPETEGLIAAPHAEGPPPPQSQVLSTSRSTTETSNVKPASNGTASTMKLSQLFPVNHVKQF